MSHARTAADGNMCMRGQRRVGPRKSPTTSILPYCADMSVYIYSLVTISHLSELSSIQRDLILNYLTEITSKLLNEMYEMFSEVGGNEENYFVTVLKQISCGICSLLSSFLTTFYFNCLHLNTNTLTFSSSHSQNRLLTSVLMHLRRNY